MKKTAVVLIMAVSFLVVSLGAAQAEDLECVWIGSIGRRAGGAGPTHEPLRHHAEQ